MASIPEHAKIVFKGVLFDIYQWEQKMFDGTFKTFEAVKRISTVQIIAITKSKKIILLKEEQPYVGKFISVPGGQVERDENHKQSAKKELLEETGMITDNLVLWRKNNVGSKIVWDSYYYIAKNCEKLYKSNPENGEKIEQYEVTFDEFIKETQKEEFRNKTLTDMIFRIIHTPIELDKFKEILDIK